MMTKVDVPAGPLVSTEWLAAHLGDPAVAVVDGSWYLPAMKRDGHAEHLAARIPGAVFFDIEAISDHSTDLPHMMPTAQAFAAAVGSLGINQDKIIVVYDGMGLFSAPRVWWMFRTFGARNVFVLDGGLPKWSQERRPTQSGEAARAATTFVPTFDERAIAGTEDVRSALETGAAQVADARAPARFAGLAPEPRAGIPSGHMPRARNLSATELVTDGRLKSPAQILEAFAHAGVDPDRPLITSCGSGVSAAILNIALAAANKPAPRLYDGSWTEWASRADTPIEPKPA